MKSKLIVAAAGVACALSVSAVSKAPNLDDFDWSDGKDLTVEGLAFADTDDGTSSVGLRSLLLRLSEVTELDAERMPLLQRGLE